jgi:cytochrome c
MNKIIFIIILIFISACSEKPSINTPIEEPQNKESVINNELRNKHEGETLIENSDCMSCHKVDTKLVGPSYQEINQKYSDKDIDQLTTKIIEGGKGVWGEVPMPPHASMSKEDAQKIAKYILTLKK